MQPLRLAIVTARFWPFVADDERFLLRLAGILLAQGHAVQVVAAGWKRSWPAEMCVGEVPLVRLRGAPKSPFAALRWMYSLNRWLQERANQYDAIVVAGLRQEAYVAVRALAEQPVPVILLAQEGDLDWQRTAAFGSRIASRCNVAAAVIATSATERELLVRAGHDPARLHVLPLAADLPPPRGPIQRDRARDSLGAANHDLIATDTIPVALAAGRLDERSRFGDLVRAWRIITSTRHNARLWIVGDGPLRERLFRQISDLDLQTRVLLPGTFDGLSELIQAADLFVQAGVGDAAPLALVEALAAGLPAVATDCPAVREVIEHGATGCLAPPEDPRQLAGAMESLLADPAHAVVLGWTARDRLKSLPTPAERAAELVRVIQQLSTG